MLKSVILTNFFSSFNNLHDKEALVVVLLELTCGRIII